jgi:hypothetical protein
MPRAAIGPRLGNGEGGCLDAFEQRLIEQRLIEQRLGRVAFQGLAEAVIQLTGVAVF